MSEENTVSTNLEQKKKKRTGKDSSSLKRLSFDDDSTWLTRAIYVLLSVMIIFSVIAYGGVDVWAVGINSILAGLIAVFWIVDSLKKGVFSYNFSSLYIPILGLIGIALIQLLPLRSTTEVNQILSVPAASSLSLDPYLTRIFLFQLLIAFVFFSASVTFINNRKRFQSVVLTIIIFSSLMAFFGILQHLANPEALYGLRPFGQSSPFASFFNKHHFAAFMEMTIGLTLALLFGDATKSNKKIFFIIAAVIMGLAIILTGSRGGIMSLLGVLGFVVFINFIKNRAVKNKDASEEIKQFFLRRNLILFGGTFALIVMLFLAVLFVGGDQSLLRGFGLMSIEGDVTTGRSHFWWVALQIFLEHPIIGAGFDSFGVAFTKYDTWSGFYRVEQAHNDYLQILADGGILSFACIVGFIYLLFKKGIQTIKTHEDKFVMHGASGALAGCLGIIIHSFFDFPLRTPSNALVFLMMATLAVVPLNYSKVFRKKKRVED